MPDADIQNQTGSCPQCRLALHLVEKHNNDQPFWLISARFFSMPFNIEALWVFTIALILSLFYYLHNFTIILTPLLIITLISHYGRLIYQSMLDRKKDTPALTAFLSLSNIKKNAHLTLILSLCLLSPLMLYHYVGLTSAFCLAIISLTALPGLIILRLDNQNTTNDILRYLKKIGWSYFGLVAYIITAYVSCLIMSDFAQQYLPTLLTPLITTAVFCYFSITLFGIFAFISCQHTNLAKPESPPILNDSQSYSHSSSQRLDADIDIALKKGAFVEVTSILEKELKRNNSSDLRRDQLYKLLMAKKEFEVMERYAQLFLSLLMARGKLNDAIDFIETLKEHNPDFKLYDIELSLSLAEAFYKSKNYIQILWLANEGHARFDRSHELVKLYLLAAKTLLSQFDDKKNARHFLDYITDHFADDPISEPAKILQKHVFKKRSFG